MKAIHWSVGLAVLALAPEASAQGARRVRLGVERLFGFTYNSVTSSSTTTMGAVTTTRETTSEIVALNLFGASFSSSVAPAQIGLFAVVQAPRLAIDFEVAPNLTVGGAVFFAWSSLSDPDGNGVSVTSFGVAPRVGYWLALGDRFAFWPRAGVTFSYASSSPRTTAATTTSSSNSYLPLWVNIEPTFAYALADHFALTFGGICDIPVIGDVSATTRVTTGGATTEVTRDSTLKQFVIGATFGVLGRF